MKLLPLSAFPPISSSDVPASDIMLAHSVSINEALSGVFGSVSLTAWICLLIPQLITNYKAKSAEGLSMGFLAIWLFGDVTNLSGALVTGLAPTATALAGYFCISDAILITQCVYYNMRNARRAGRRRYSSSAEPSEDEPLLRQNSTPSRSSRHRRSFHDESAPDASKQLIPGDGESISSNPWVNNSLALITIYCVGIMGWFVSYRVGAWDRPDGADVPDPSSPAGISGMVLGYASCLCYLCARIPQIVKNYRQKSCEGLAILFFLFSLTGNLMYGLSVFSYSQDIDYLVKATPWLVGSLGTIIEDSIIFYQFSIYSRGPSSENGVDGITDAHESA
ncbi:putative vacuolar membrane pq loop repeat protein [Rosellinia necatrix]|uniref:Putative vacuolar membrane pq loop repeat protein n=1 Tax=Rosellinia necatrix TaxID=77044 RepID=A0A1W2TGJ0_ROSNE|nr:putative vacuolar membrane pq loop repeat protein [Rosellinia necatrix]